MNNLIAVDTSPYPVAVSSVEIVAHFGTAGHSQDTPRKRSKSIQSDFAAESRSFPYKLFSLAGMSFHRIMQSLSQTLKLEDVQVHSNRTQTLA